LKKHEIESLLKSFLLFFISLGIFLGFIFYLNYQQKTEDLKQDIFAQMRVCSFDLVCPDFKIDFKSIDVGKPLFLYEVNDTLEAYFAVPTSNKYYLSLTYPHKNYIKDKQTILTEHSLTFLLYLFVIFILSLLFSFYALHPMKKALFTIEEFIKDILHDFNTPISAIILNSSLLKKDVKNREKIQRIEQSSYNILSLQENLKAHLCDIQTQKEEFDLAKLLIKHQKSLQKIYPNISWHIDTKSFKIKTNKSSFSRIISNLLTNAVKYNKKNGSITLSVDTKNKTLSIKDTGIGIKNPKKIFDRFYTENSRGTGLGLHIVKKLCDELRIEISVTSSKAEGSCFKLNLHNLHIANKSLL
jgi:signal transduction histidine kinase